MQTENSKRNLCQKNANTKIVTETCLKHILYYAN